ncbi:uL30 family ribosomal protein [Kineococcus glutinatus]|uniref:Large ribosomal subunit protein uL30-like ferredoxin-like fold domain-containing protein n=1 Tax=Kineococcus glutinatus TaxID=1070872 RepID=A0ABP9HFB7_9ACTN
MLQSNDISWSSIATVPQDGTLRLPLPGTAAFKRAKGRSGDWLVIQIASAIGSTAKQRGALRTLGLRGPNTLVLRSSADVSTKGSIRTVRHLVAVVELDGIYYRQTEAGNSEGGDVSIENQQYGTETSPGQLWRDPQGEYFGYRSERDSTLAYWSSELTLHQLVETAYQLPEVSLSDDVRVKYWTVAEPQRGAIRHDSSVKSLPGAESVNEPISHAVIDLPNEQHLMWKAPFRKFGDRQTTKGEVRLLGEPIDEVALRALVRATANEVFMARANCNIQVRRQGKLRQHDL